MRNAILVLNSGSSSIKFSLFERGSGGQLCPLFKGKVQKINQAPQLTIRDAQGRELESRQWPAEQARDYAGLLAYVLEWIKNHPRTSQLVAVGHRVVHGGPDYDAPVLITPLVLDELRRLNSLAPLHQPHNLAAVEIIGELYPQLDQVACFDTAFHTTIPANARTFALPRDLTQEGVRRYGFHGLSYEYIADQLPQYDSHAFKGRTVVAHLGSGASMCALQRGRSVESTMGFSALEGLPMGTRTGALDPGVILYLLQEKKMGVTEVETLLYRQSGLKGLSGISNDMRILLRSNHAHAEAALAVYVYAIQRHLGALTAALGGLDALVFTAGIGENAAEIRRRVCDNAGWPDIRIDPSANNNNGPCISRQDSPVAVWVIPTNEELMIARHTAAVTS